MNANSIIVSVAQGFGLGKIPIAPGTFGSVGGVVWFAFLLWFSSGAFFVIGTVFAIAASVWAGTRVERWLGEKDPSSVVLDEIAAVPVCFAGLIAMRYYEAGRISGIDFFFGAQGWPWTAGVFVAFRFFDVLKPWPVWKTQTLPGGWGITLDDLAAAIYVNILTVLIAWWK